MDFATRNECKAYCTIINKILQRSKPQKFPAHLYTYYLPVQPNNLLDRCRDGILLAHLLADLAPHTKGSLAKLTPCLLHVGSASGGTSNVSTPSTGTSSLMEESSNVFILRANLDTVLTVMARAAGIVVVNAGASDVIEGKKEQVLGVIWQIVRAHMLCKLSLRKVPELVVLREPTEELEVFLEVKPEQLLIRWVNWVLVGGAFHSLHPKRLKFIARDLIDGEIWVMLLNALFPEVVTREMVQEFFCISHLSSRAFKVVELAQLVDQNPLLEPVDILEENVKLSIAFLCELFSARSESFVAAVDKEDSRLKELGAVMKAKYDCSGISEPLVVGEPQVNSLTLNIDIEVPESQVQTSNAPILNVKSLNN